MTTLYDEYIINKFNEGHQCVKIKDGLVEWCEKEPCIKLKYTLSKFIMEQQIINKEINNKLNIQDIKNNSVDVLLEYYNNIYKLQRAQNIELTNEIYLIKKNINNFIITFNFVILILFLSIYFYQIIG
jgi:hypothetical protein